jgi:hypothetical protein
LQIAWEHCSSLRGQFVKYTVTVRNSVPSDAQSVDVSDTASKVAAEIARFTLTVQTIALQVWIASGVLLVFLWFRATTSHVKPPTPN